MGKLLWTSALSSLFSRSWWIHLRCSPAGRSAECRPRNSPAGTCEFRNLLHVFYFSPFRIFPKLLWGFRQHWEPQRCLRLFRRMRTPPRGEKKENKQDVPNLHPLPVINKRLVGRKRHLIYAQNKTREWWRSKWVAGEFGVFYLAQCLRSDRGLTSRIYHPLSGSLSPAASPLSCLLFFLPVNPPFVLPFSIPVSCRIEATLSLLPSLALSLSNPQQSPTLVPQ